MHILGYIPFGFPGEKDDTFKTTVFCQRILQKGPLNTEFQVLVCHQQSFKKGLIPSNPQHDKLTHSGEVYGCIVVSEVIISCISWC